MKRKMMITLGLIAGVSLFGCGTTAISTTTTNTDSNADSEIDEGTTENTIGFTDAATEFIQILTSPDKYTWYMQNYVGKNLATCGYTSLGGDRMDSYGAGHIELCIVTDDGSYIDIEDETTMQQYVVVAQSLAPNTEIKYTFMCDEEGNEYDNLVLWQNYEQIDLLVAKVGSEVDKNAPILVENTASPNRYSYYIRNYVGKNLALVGYTSLGGDRMDAYGAAYLELVLVAEDGSFIDIEDAEALAQFVIYGQDIEPNTEFSVTYLKDDEGNEYDNLIENQDIEKVTLYVKRL